MNTARRRSAIIVTMATSMYKELEEQYHNTIVSRDVAAWKALNALYTEPGAKTERPFLQMGWHATRDKWLHAQWKNKDLSHLAWVRDVDGIDAWRKLTMDSSATLDNHDGNMELRKKWHAEMLSLLASKDYFKADSRAISLLDFTPPLSWLISAMSSPKPTASSAINTYYPGAFEYFNMLESLNIKPMQHMPFRNWMLHNKKPLNDVSLELPDLAV